LSPCPARVRAFSERFPKVSFVEIERSRNFAASSGAYLRS